MSSIAESPIKAGVDFPKFRESKGVSGFKGADLIGFGVGDGVFCF